MTLFEDEGPPADGLATKEQVRALVFYGYRESIVRGWPAARAAAVLGRCKADERRVARRALSLASRQGEGEARGRASFVERELCARAVEDALAGPADELLPVVSASLYALSDEELRGLAETLPGLYRAGLPRAEGEAA